MTPPTPAPLLGNSNHTAVLDGHHDDDAADDDDEPLQLSAYSLAALKEFLQQQHHHHHHHQQQEDEQEEGQQKQHIMPAEDWQKSQFWYTPHTASALVVQALARTKDGDSIACISCPSVYLAYKKMNPKPNRRFVCFEFDARFAVYGQDFQFYDYNHPLLFVKTHEIHPSLTTTTTTTTSSSIIDPSLCNNLEKSFDFIIADPPFLSQECFEKTSRTIHHVAKFPCPQTPSSSSSSSSQTTANTTPILVCTGKVMAQHVMKNIQCAKRTRFHPRHASGLSNEFCCFANYNINHTDGMKTGENVKEEKEEDDFGWATSEDEEV